MIGVQHFFYVCIYFVSITVCLSCNTNIDTLIATQQHSGVASASPVNGVRCTIVALVLCNSHKWSEF